MCVRKREVVCGMCVCVREREVSFVCLYVCCFVKKCMCDKLAPL